MPTKKQMAELLDFIHDTPSPPPPVFVGRKDVIHAIEGRMPNILKTCGRPKSTRLLQGAPGAGKSSILAELDRRSVEHQTYNVLVLSSENLNDMEGVMESLSIAAGLSSGRWRKGILESLTRCGATAIQSVTGITGLREISGSLMERIGESPKNMFALSRKFPGSDWKIPLILAIDEAQRFVWPQNSEQAFFLQSLHDNDPRLPILPVFAGLGDLRDVIQKAGLSRLEYVYGIECLTEEDRNDYLQKFRIKFGLVTGDGENAVNQNLQKLLDDTEGWPRHMHHSFQALGDSARLVDGDLSRVNWKHVHDDALKRRRRYFDSQFSPEMRSSAFLTGTIMRNLGENMRLVMVNSLIEHFVRSESGWRLPKGMDVDEFRRHLVHQGALQERLDHMFHCPIPSLRTYLAGNADGIEPVIGTGTS